MSKTFRSRRRQRPAAAPDATTTAPQSAAHDYHGWIWATTLFLAVFLLFISRTLLEGKPRPGGGGDTVGTRLLPISILKEGNLDLDEFPQLRQGAESPYFLVRVNGHDYSALPVGGAFFLVPVYAIAYGCGLDVFNDELTRDLVIASTASFICALAVLVVFLTYARHGRFRALVVALAFGLGTSVWAMCAEDVWQHTFGILFVSIILYLLERSVESPASLGWIGLPAGLLFFVRSANAPLIAILIAYVLIRRPRQIFLFAALAVPFLGAVLAYNLGVLGHIFGGYSDEASAMSLRHLPTALPGLLLSPSRGLLIYSPFVLLASLAPWWRKDEHRGVRCVLASMIVVQLLMYGSYVHWYGGYSFGPRFLLEVMPAFAGLLWHAWPICTAHVVGRLATATLLLWSMLAGSSGYLIHWGTWSSHPDIDRCKGRLWDWRDNPLVAACGGLPNRCRHPLEPGPVSFRTPNGVGLELGRGWTQHDENNRLCCIGAESEMILHFNGQPVSQLSLSLRAQEGLRKTQRAIVCYNGQRRVDVALSTRRTTQIVLPLSAEDRAGGQGKLTLHFTSWQRTWPDMRPFAAQLVSMQAQFATQTAKTR